MKNYRRAATLSLGSAMLCIAIACSGSDAVQDHSLDGIPAPTANKRASNTNTNKMEKEPKRLMPEGSWGAIGLSMTTEGETVLITFDCANARIDKRPELDRDGNFDVTGVFIRQRPGPLRMGDQRPEQPARFVGKVTGKTMDLTISLIKGGEQIGKYSLEHGKEARIRRCL